MKNESSAIGIHAGRKLDHPEAIFVQLSSSCNAKCINCPHHFTYGPAGHHSKGVMKEVVWNKIIQDIKSMGYRNQVGLYLHHEPLMDSSLFSKIKNINSQTEAFVVLSTNGSLLDDRVGKKLIEAKPRIVHVNINSAERDQYNKMTGLNFDRTIKNVKKFIEETSNSIQVEINCPVLPEVDTQKIVQLFPNMRVNVDFWANSRGGLLPDITSKNRGSRFKIGGYCLQPKQNFNILFDGSVILCCNDWGHESISDFPNVMESSIYEIYSSELMAKIVQEFKAKIYRRYKMCTKCAQEMGFVEDSFEHPELISRSPHLMKKGGANPDTPPVLNRFDRKTDTKEMAAPEYRDAQELISQKEYTRAIEKLEEIVKDNPDFALAYNDLGVLYYEQAEKDKAFICYDKATSLEPRNPTFQKNLADFYFVEKERPERALEIYHNILAENPEEIDSLFAIGLICIHLRREENSIPFFKRILRINPGHKNAKDILLAFRTNRRGSLSRNLNLGRGLISEGESKMDHGTKKLQILLTNHHLLDFTGSEIFTLNIAAFLSKRGHEVAVYSKYVDKLHPILDSLGIRVVQNLDEIKNEDFDIAHVHHNINALEVRYFFPDIPMIYLSHGVLPFLEQPPIMDIGISQFLAVSEEVREHLIRLGIHEGKIAVFRNIVDSQKFSPVHALRDIPQKALVLSNKIDKENESLIRRSCENLGISCDFVGMRFKEIPQENLPFYINRSDIVFSLGRGVIETMMCGRIPIVLDYNGSDGMVSPMNYHEIKKCNFSGRRYGFKYNVDQLVAEIKKYNPLDGAALRKLALIDFDAQEKILDLEAHYKKVTEGDLHSHYDLPSQQSLKGFINSLEETRYYTQIQALRRPITANTLKKKEIDLHIGKLLNKLSGRKVCNDPWAQDDGCYDILIPIYNAFDYVNLCVRSVIHYTTSKHNIFLLDDASTDPRIMPLLELFAKENRNVQVLHSEKNLGFVENTNRGLNLSRNHVVILNSDTEVTGNWLKKMHQCLMSDSQIGIVCPLSNNATILSVPTMNKTNQLPTGMDIAQFAEIVEKSSKRQYPRIPTAVGFCMLISRAVIDQVERFDPVFGSGYGEENDFCMRARSKGFEIACCDDAYVHHYGEASFREIDLISEKRGINHNILTQKWPEYNKNIFSFCRRNPLRDIQERIYTSIKNREEREKPSVLHVIHNFDAPGGTELHTRNIIDGLSGKIQSTVLYPSSQPDQWTDMASEERTDFLRVVRFVKENIRSKEFFLGYPAGIYNEAIEESFSRFLSGGKYEIVHFQHFLNWSTFLLPIIAKSLGKKVIISLHDYFLLCPEYNFILPGMQTRCGKRRANGEDAECLYCLGAKRFSLENKNPMDLRNYLHERFHVIKKMLKTADRIIVPSRFVRNIFLEAMDNSLSEKVLVVPHGIEPLKPNRRTKRSECLRVGFLGNTNERKGIAVLMKAASILKGKPVRFYIFGNVPPNLRKAIEDLKIVVHGSYNRIDLPHLLRDIDLVVIPSIWDETFCLTVSEAQSLAIPVIASKVGAIQERIEDGKSGFLFPPGDANSLVSRLLDLIRNPEPLTSIQEYLRSIKLKTIEENVGDYSKIYSTLLTETGSRIPKINMVKRTQGGFSLEPMTSDRVSIILLTFNQVEYTKKCVDSIQKNTPEPHQIIFIDNGSKDGTLQWLRKMAKENSNYLVIENEKNLGFAKGCNQGIEGATGKYLLLLNNDVVVTEEWLLGMRECLESSPQIGIVGPMTNQISGIQKIPNALQQSIEHLDEFARSFREKNRHRQIPSRRIVGFCMFFRRELIERIGLLDENFGTGNFEDDDFCLRAELEGFSNVIAGDVFIHHYGSRSFIGNQIDYRSSMGGNRKIFLDKWKGIDYKSPLGRKLLSLQEKEEAWKFYHQDQLEKAAEKFLTALKISPQDEAIYLSFGEMLIDAKRYQEAFDILEQLPLEKRNDQIYAGLGYCLEGLGRIAEADEFAEKSLSVKPGNALALNLKGTLAYRRGQKEEAAAVFQKAIQADPGYGEPCTNLGVMKWEAGEREAALNFLERGFILSPTGTDNLQLYHSAVSETGAFERAEKFLVEAEALHPKHKKIQYLLVDVLLRQEKNEAAMERIESSIAHFGMDGGMMKAALEVRKKIGSREIPEKAEKGTVSLCMIVKDEEKYLARCLQSAKTIVDEMIVVDTGSSDRTKELATIFGAKVFDFAWENDFSSARNDSLSRASGDWILVLDADEMISEKDQHFLCNLRQKRNDHPRAFSFVTRNYVNRVDLIGFTPNDGSYAEEEGEGWTPSEKVRLFPNDRRSRFENPVHEMIRPTLEKNQVTIHKCPVPVHHYGKLDSEREKEKGERYYTLGRKKLELHADLSSLTELAIQAGALGHFDEAILLWNQVLVLDPKMTDAYINLSYNHLKLKRYVEAAQLAQRARELDPDSKEGLLNYSSAEFFCGNIERSVASLEDFLPKCPEYPPILGLLSLAYFLEGKIEKGLPLVEKLKRIGFNYKKYVLDSAQDLIAAGQEQKAAKLIEITKKSHKRPLRNAEMGIG